MLSLAHVKVDGTSVLLRTRSEVGTGLNVFVILINGSEHFKYDSFMDAWDDFGAFVGADVLDTAH